nr:YraN family protein [uncultured Allomuricauda sp.]
MGQHNAFGQEGEQIALDFLIGKGYKIVQQNFRYDRAEIDILAQLDKILAVVEVKTRTSGFLEDLTQTITKKKIQRLVKAADYFINQNNLDLEVRFDLILIRKKGQHYDIEHLENAFYHF